jgi:hypothetical protein
MEHGLMAKSELEQIGWENAIDYVLDIIKDMKYNDNLSWNNETLEELEQRIV